MLVEDAAARRIFDLVDFCRNMERDPPDVFPNPILREGTRGLDDYCSGVCVWVFNESPRLAVKQHCLRL